MARRYRVSEATISRLLAAYRANAHAAERAGTGGTVPGTERVAGVLPGLTNTPILKKTGHDNDYAPWMAPILANNAMCQPEDIAEAVVMLVEDDGLPGGDWVAVRHIDGKIEHQWGHDTPA